MTESEFDRRVNAEIAAHIAHGEREAEIEGARDQVIRIAILIETWGVLNPGRLPPPMLTSLQLAVEMLRNAERQS